jgi:cobalt/nickel transport system permease protein
VSFVRQIPILVSIYIFTLFLAYISKIRIWFFIKRVWIFIPIFAGLIAIPAIFDIFTPGEPIYSFFVFGKQVSITRQGLLGAVLLVTRVATSVSLVVLLTVTTRQVDILKSLRVFGVPKIFVMTLGMMYRYVFLFIKVLEDMHLAIKSRIIRKRGAKFGQRWVASRMSAAWQKSRKLSEDIYLAMVSRGYTGEPKSIEWQKKSSK